MRRRPGLPVLLVAALALLAATPPPTTSPTPPPIQGKAHPEFDIKVAPLTIEPGGSAEAQVTLVVGKDWKMVGAPVPNKWITAMEFLVEASSGLHAEPSVLPASKTVTDAEGFRYQAFDGTFVIKVPVNAASNTKPGDYTLPARLRYQLVDTTDVVVNFRRPAVATVDLQVHVAGTKKKKEPGAPSPTRR